MAKRAKYIMLVIPILLSPFRRDLANNVQLKGKPIFSFILGGLQAYMALVAGVKAFPHHNSLFIPLPSIVLSTGGSLATFGASAA